MASHRTITLDLQQVAISGVDGPMLMPCTFTARSGDVVALVGENGSGKTTALRLLAGEVSPTHGRVSVLGGSPRQVYRSVRATINEPSFWPWLTARTTLEVVSRLYGAKPRGVEELLHEVGLSADRTGRDISQLRVGRFSQGMRKRLQVASALVVPAPVYLIDEPVTSLDDDGTQRIWNVILRRAEAGSTVVVATHEVHHLVDTIPDAQMVQITGATA